MQDDDIAVSDGVRDGFDNVFRRLCCTPIARIAVPHYGFEPLGSGDGENPLVAIPVWRPKKPGRAAPSYRAKVFIGIDYLGCHGFIRHRRHRWMIKTMIGDFMPLGRHTTRELWMRCRPVAENEKGRLGVRLFQCTENLRQRPLARLDIECKGHALRSPGAVKYLVDGNRRIGL